MSRLSEAQIQENIRRIRLQQIEHIKTQGFTVIGVFPTEDRPITPFAYSIGLSIIRGWPELLVMGNLSQQSTMMLMHEVVNYWKEKGSPVMGDIPVEGIPGDKVRVQLVTDPKVKEEYTVQVKHFKGDENYTVLQLLWPDNAGVLPNEQFFDSNLIQPLLPSLNG